MQRDRAQILAGNAPKLPSYGHPSTGDPSVRPMLSEQHCPMGHTMMTEYSIFNLSSRYLLVLQAELLFN
jgi:hypothetical protein